MADLPDLIQPSEDARDTSPIEDTDETRDFSYLGRQFRRKYREGGTMSDNDEAIRLLYEASKATLDDHPNRARVLNDLGVYLGDRYLETKNLGDLEEAIQVIRSASDISTRAHEAGGLIPEDNPDRARILINLGLYLMKRYKETENVRDIDEAIELTRMALGITTGDSPRAEYSIRLGQHLYKRYYSRHATADLEEAIRVTHIGLTMTPDGSDQAKPLGFLGLYLYSRYWRSTRTAADLDEAIRITRIAARVASETDSKKALYMSRLGSYLATRYSSTEDIADLEDSIQSMQASVDITPRGHSIRGPTLAKLAMEVALKYLRDKDISDLENAIRISWAAVDETAPESQTSRLLELHSLVLRKYHDTDAINDLNELIQVDRLLLNAAPGNDPRRAGYFATLGTRFRARYGSTGEKSDLEEAIRLTRAAMNEPAEDDWRRQRISKQLRVFLRDLSFGLGPTSHLQDAAVQFTRAVVMATPEDTSAKTAMLNSFMAHLSDLCLIFDAVEFSEQVVRATKAAFDVAPTSHPIRITLLKYLAESLVENFEQTWDMATLNEAIRVLKEAVNTAPDDHDCLVSMVTNLRDCLDRRYDETEELADLEDAIDVLRSTLHIDAENALTQSNVLYTLGKYLGEKYKTTGAPDSLEDAIVFTRQAIDIVMERGNRRRFLAQLGTLLGRKYRRTRAMVDLEDAIHVTRAAAEEAQNKLNKAPILNNLGHLFSERYASTDSVADLTEAVRVTQEAVKGTVGGPREPIYFNSLCTHLCDLFRRTGIVAHLEEAIRAQRAAVSRVSKDDPERPTYLASLGDALYLRYSEIETESDLEEAIRVLQQAIDSSPQDWPDKARYLNTICICLNKRHQRTGARSDLDEAVRAAYAALDAAPKGHPNRAITLRTLGHRLSDLYAVTGVIEELEKAIKLTKEAVDITSGRADEADALNSLGLHFAEKYKKTAEAVDVEEAIRLTRIAVDITPKIQKRPRYLKNLALYLRDKYEEVQTMASLDEAIQAADAAVEVTPDDHPDHADAMGNLGTILEERFSKTKAIHDLQRAILYHQSALRQANAHILTRIEAGIDILRCCALNSDWQQAYEAVLIAVGLVPTLTLRSLKNSDKQHLLSQAAGLASDAAAAAFNAAKEPHAALGLLEQGRGLLATSLEEMRADVLSLREKHPDLAEEFARLQEELSLQAAHDETSYYSHGNRHSLLHARTSQLYQADRAFDQLLVNIRSQPGFTTFLLPPSPEEMMQAAANGGPIIVINISEYRSDAIIVERDQIRVLPLRHLRSHDVDERSLKGDLGAPHVLAWLWDVAAKPVLDALGYTSCPLTKDWPRVWWIPTGSLSRFPLHAAGRHGQSPGEAVIDRVMSSYSSSIKAIIHSRQRPIRLEHAPSTLPQALLVAMQNTPRYAPLQFANTEVEIVRDICKEIPAAPVDPGQLRDDIVAHLPNCYIFHFAGHGYTDRVDPSQSHLAVYNDKITVAALLEMNLRERSPFLAYLSACGTGQIREDRFLDESIHLISACQLAGFRHVIGTLWEVNDELCTEMARVTYEGIRDGGMTDYSVCLGLHNASRELRNTWLQKKEEGNSRKDVQTAVAFSNHKSGEGSSDVKSVANSRLPRDVQFIEDEEDGREPPAFWIPYVHFGV
ncbi:CHAT domain-containing protein [Xylariaceae sp. AK1471]|nr:CHAT domain-containing protein [Xylariaceae sp. AK1471]